MGITCNVSGLYGLGPGQNWFFWFYPRGGASASAPEVDKDQTVLHLVLPPLSAGQHRIEVQTPGRTQRYDLTVSAPASLAPAIFRDPGGELFALQGPARRQVPDAQTKRHAGLVR